MSRVKRGGKPQINIIKRKLNRTHRNESKGGMGWRGKVRGNRRVSPKCTCTRGQKVMRVKKKKENKESRKKVAFRNIKSKLT